MEIRPGDVRDTEQINDIYNHYVRTSSATFDLDEIDMEGRRKWFDAFGGRYRLVVAVDGNTVLGYACTKPLFERRAYETTAVSSVYIHADHHRRGIGTALYEVLYELLKDQDLHRLNAGITLPNAGSIALHERFGFRQVALFSEHGRKFGKYWDVAWFEKAL